MTTNSPLNLKMQLKQHLVALLSLSIAITALLYNSWRNETSEVNRNWRVASFALLQSLGELQVVTNLVHYRHAADDRLTIRGWGQVMLIEDLSLLLPPPMPDNAKQLKAVWQDNWSKLGQEDSAEAAISKAIGDYREQLRQFIVALD